MQRNKNFYRYELLKLAELYGDKPLVFSGIYKHADDSNWVTLSTIKLFASAPTKMLCSHINLERAEVDLYLKLSAKENQRKIYFLGIIKSYQHYGTARGGISLIRLENDLVPIWISKTSVEENQEIAKRIESSLPA
ncbi:MAG: hypothetical protein DA405_12775 [Bacteroidetes bacterium]|nr:MAG: hypothetical protein DA405_12775 [Bacteroidota bacterium]